MVIIPGGHEPLKLVRGGLRAAMHRAQAWYRAQGWHDIHASGVEEAAATLSLGFVFRSSVLACRSSLLLQGLLFRGVRETKLDQVLISATLGEDWSVVELSDDVVTDFTSFKPGKSELVSDNACGKG